MSISCQLTYIELFSVKALNVTKKMCMGNCFSHEATFPSYAFNQVIKRLEIQQCWKEYWLYLHKPPFHHCWISVRTRLALLSALITECIGSSPLCPKDTDHMDLYNLMLGCQERGASATLHFPNARQMSPGEPTQSLSNNFVSCLTIRLLAGNLRSQCRCNGCELPGSARAGRQQQASSNVYYGSVFF